MSIIKLKQPGLWTLAGGLAALGDLLSLDRYEDLFDDYVLDTANIGELTANNGTVNEIGYMRAWAPANTDAAMWYRKTAFNTGNADSYTARFTLRDMGTSGWVIYIKQGEVSTPVLNGDTPVIEVVALIADLFRVRYKTSGGSFMYWNDGTGQWQSGSVNISTGINFNTAYSFVFTKTSTTWSMKLLDINNASTIFDTSAFPIAWSATFTNNNSYFLCGGDYVTTASALDLKMISLWTNYPLTPQLATHGPLDVYAALEQFPISQVGNVVWEYNKDGSGWVQPGAGQPADIEAALSGVYMDTIDFRSTLTSDAGGDDAALFDINGGVLAGPVRLPRYGVRQ